MFAKTAKLAMGIAALGLLMGSATGCCAKADEQHAQIMAAADRVEGAAGRAEEAANRASAAAKSAADAAQRAEAAADRANKAFDKSMYK